MMDCRHIDEHMLDFLYRELEPQAQEEFRTHVEGCARCGAELASLERTRQAFRALPVEEPSQAVTARLLHEAAKHAPARREAGEGGLGAWLARLFGPVAAHPALAAMASLVLVAGVAGYLAKSGMVGKGAERIALEQAPEEAAAPPAQDRPASPAGEAAGAAAPGAPAMAADEGSPKGPGARPVTTLASESDPLGAIAPEETQRELEQKGVRSKLDDNALGIAGGSSAEGRGFGALGGRGRGAGSGTNQFEEGPGRVVEDRAEQSGGGRQAKDDPFGGDALDKKSRKAEPSFAAPPPPAAPAPQAPLSPPADYSPRQAKRAAPEEPSSAAAPAAAAEADDEAGSAADGFAQEVATGTSAGAGGKGAAPAPSKKPSGDRAKAPKAAAPPSKEKAAPAPTAKELHGLLQKAVAAGDCGAARSLRTRIYRVDPLYAKKNGARLDSDLRRCEAPARKQASPDSDADRPVETVPAKY